MVGLEPYKPPKEMASHTAPDQTPPPPPTPPAGGDKHTNIAELVDLAKTLLKKLEALGMK